MKRLLYSVCAALFLISSTWSQQWIAARVASLPDAGSVDSLLKALCNEAVGTEVPPFTFRDLVDDSTHSLAEFKGRVTLVNFWGTNCSGCRMEMPDLSRLQESYSGKGLTVVFLSSQSKQVQNDFLATHPVTGTKGIIDRNQLTEPYHMLAMPSTFLVDRSGRVRDMWLGPRTFDQLEKRMLPYLTVH